MLVAGDAEGLVDLAGLGLVDPQQAILYSAFFANDPDGLQAQIDAGATLVVTDTNAKRGLRWGSIRENEGYVERADESALRWDPSDNSLAVFPDQTTASQTVAVQRGATVDATAYGNPVSYTPENRPYMAFDGDPTTAWSVGAFDDVIGERIVLSLDSSTTVDHITLQQAPGNRHITKARLKVGDRTIDVDLGPESLTAPGPDRHLPGHRGRQDLGGGAGHRPREPGELRVLQRRGLRRDHRARRAGHRDPPDAVRPAHRGRHRRPLPPALPPDDPQPRRSPGRRTQRSGAGHAPRGRPPVGPLVHRHR